MKFSVGYQLPEGDEASFFDYTADYTDSIGEVYFPWPFLPSGRSPMGARDGHADWKAAGRLLEDLRAFGERGVSRNLLLNANCMGADSLSVQYQNLIISVVEHLLEEAGLEGVTTSSLMAAHVVKENFPGVKTRASVNMRIGTAASMEAVSDLFDGFCVQRECNRDLKITGDLKNWADANGRSLVMLANSGCMNYCPGQVFHDNLVAHEGEISGVKNIEDFNPLACWRHYRKREKRYGLLHGSSWVRPEDIGNYDGYYPLVKLATRMHSNPLMVIDAYSKRRFFGNLLDLFEPSHNALFAPSIIDNACFPDDWFERSSACDRTSSECGYCSSVLEEVLAEAG